MYITKKVLFHRLKYNTKCDAMRNEKDAFSGIAQGCFV